jgi:glycosyltransferase involved in cell wall biosynthesis
MTKLIRITTVPIALKNLLSEQMKYMQQNGFDVTMISADGPERESLIQNENCNHIIVPLTRQITPIQDIKCLLQLIRIFKNECPKIVHTHTPKAGLLGMLAAKYCGIQNRFHTVAGLPLQTATGIKKKILFITEKITGWAASCILPNSQSLMQYALDNKLYAPNKVNIIGHGSSNGIDLGRFNLTALNKEKIEHYKKIIDFKKEKIYFLFIGRLVTDKGIVELAGAFEALQKIYENIELIVLGDFESIRAEESINELIISKIKQNKQIRLLGWQQEVEYFLSFCTILVHPSYREGFPNVLLQAGAMQCPIICSKIVGNIDIVDDKINGLLFEPKNIEHLYSTMKYAYENKAEMFNYSIAMLNKIQLYFDRKILQQKLYTFYKEKLLQ